MPVSFEPQQFGRYYLVDRIAVGGMAEVFKARAFSDGGFQKLLVIKRILQHLSGNDEFVEMFIDEAKISVELQHPNIVQIYDFGRIGDEYFLAMECVEGKDAKGILRKLAERRKHLPPEYAAYIALLMCKGLDFAHKKTNLHGEALGIVHRDISPSNILVSYRGEVKVADFGIAKAENSLYNTKDGVLKGKFEYMSPEQASGESVGPSSDIFATGIILHEMLTGRRLFKTDSDIKTLNKIKAVDIEPPSATNPAVPARLDEIVMRALSRDPSDRFADARGFQQALLEFLYPSTPDVIHESLARFMQELFSEEIATERGRLQEGSQRAQEMWSAEPALELDPEWEESPSSVHTVATAQKGSSKVALLGVAMAMLVLALMAFVWVRTAADEPAPAPVVEVAAPQLASLQLRIEPPEAEVVVSLNGETVAQGSSSLIAKGIEPGADVPLVVTAEGFETYEDTLDFVGNERLRIPVVLTPVAPSPRATTAAALADDRPPAPAPTPAPEAAPAPVPEAAPAPAVTRPRPAPAPAPEPAGPGKLNVNVRGGWANVFIDGKSVDTTPLVGHALPAGRHTIRVVNEGTGVDETKTVTISPGELTKVVF